MSLFYVRNGKNEGVLGTDSGNTGRLYGFICLGVPYVLSVDKDYSDKSGTVDTLIHIADRFRYKKEIFPLREITGFLRGFCHADIPVLPEENEDVSVNRPLFFGVVFMLFPRGKRYFRR